jgi:heme/copper-type cytochrome/quinol oxidase subunit 2
MELCGSDHTDMTGNLILVEQEVYENGIDEDFA